MNWQPNITWQQAQQQAQLLTKIRSFFAERGVVEVITPILANASVTDVHLDAFVTDYVYATNTDHHTASKLYCQTSPEFAMKRLLASGFGCCYQLAKAFRHEQQGRYHNPEFTLLEWYRLGFTYHELMAEVSALLQQILGCEAGDKISYQALFIQYLDIDPLTASKAQLLDVITINNQFSDWLNDESKDSLLQFIMASLIEPKIAKQRPLFVYDFPASQASLAKINEKDSRVAERFECYFQGIELANGFTELTDAKQQYARFQQDNQQRLALDKPRQAIDEKFIAALQHGLPKCAGVALGIDRLFMLALAADSIEQVLTFTTEQA